MATATKALGCNYFFIEAVPTHRTTKRCPPKEADGFIYMPSSSSRSMAMPTGSIVAIALFCFLKALQSESHYRLPNLPQPPQQSLYFVVYYGGFGLQKKVIRLPRKSVYTS